MLRRGLEWWHRLRVQQKVWTILVAVFVSLVTVLSMHALFINHLLTVQLQRQQIVLAREQVHILLRHMLDIEGAFRGYLLTRQDIFLKPLEEAEVRIQPTFSKTVDLLKNIPNVDVDIDIQGLSERLQALLDSKRRLIKLIRAGRDSEALNYIRSGRGLALSNGLRDEFRTLEERLDARLQSAGRTEAIVTQYPFLGFLLVVGFVLALGVLGFRLLTRSIMGPLAQLHASVTQLSDRLDQKGTVEAIAIHSTDEIGQLARSYEDMTDRIKQQIRELEAMNAIGHEISMIGSDGLDGVLRRITDGAADLLQVDVCLVMLRNDQMGCWIVEAASGEWNDRLHKSVMLWEEFPVSVRAFETGQPAIGEDLRSDLRPEVARRNQIGQSMLSIPLRAQGVPFGVLVLLKERKVPSDHWNVRVAQEFADVAAIAMTNARLYEAVHQRGKEYETRLRQLEHLAEMLAHDLKAPGQRMEGLASLLLAEYGGQLDDRAARWLRLIDENGKELAGRVENILKLALVGGRHAAVEAVDPVLVVNDVLKERAEEFAGRSVLVQVDRIFPMVACHRAYLRQVFDNLLSNAIKFAADRADPHIRVAAQRKGDLVHISVSDNGGGIPSQHQTRVFEPFVRLNHRAPGSGIGLTIVKRIVELYGGSVWIESQERAGCTVTFTLPVLGDLSVHQPVAESVGVTKQEHPTA